MNKIILMFISFSLLSCISEKLLSEFERLNIEHGCVDGLVMFRAWYNTVERKDIDKESREALANGCKLLSISETKEEMNE